MIALTHMGRLQEASKLLNRLADVIVRDNAVHEVYKTNGRYFSNLFYTSEAPLTWSARMIIMHSVITIATFIRARPRQKADSNYVYK